MKPSAEEKKKNKKENSLETNTFENTLTERKH